MKRLLLSKKQSITILDILSKTWHEEVVIEKKWQDYEKANPWADYNPNTDDKMRLHTPRQMDEHFNYKHMIIHEFNKSKDGVSIICWINIGEPTGTYFVQGKSLFVVFKPNTEIKFYE